MNGGGHRTHFNSITTSKQHQHHHNSLISLISPISILSLLSRSLQGQQAARSASTCRTRINDNPHVQVAVLRISASPPFICSLHCAPRQPSSTSPSHHGPSSSSPPLTLLVLPTAPQPCYNFLYNVHHTIHSGDLLPFGRSLIIS